MQNYVLNANQQLNGDHEVHIIGCIYTPDSKNQIQLGLHFSCTSAVTKAKQLYPEVRINGCRTCSLACHTS